MSEGRPVLDQINLVVKDMDAMVALYRHLGCEIASSDPTWDPHHRPISVDGLDFDLDSEQFAAVWNHGYAGRTGAVVGFRLPTREAVDTLYAALVDAGYGGQQAPYDAFWGARYAVVADPDGNSVGLMSPADPAHRSPPPNPPF